MTEVTKLAYEKTLIEMSTGDSILQALAIIAMLAFIIWNIKLIFEPTQTEKVSVTKKTKVKETKIEVEIS